MFNRILAAGACLAVVSISCARAETTESVRVGFELAPLAEAEREQRTVGPDEPIFVQRMTAVKSVTLQEAAEGLPAGARLIMAKGRSGREFYCGGPVNVLASRLMFGGTVDYTWKCFLDENADGVFDLVHDAQNGKGVLIPSFQAVGSANAAAARYVEDPAEARNYYDVTVTHGKTFNLYGYMFFYLKARRQGEAEWRNMVSVTSGTQGGDAKLKAKDLPGSITLNGVRFRVLAVADGKMTTQVETARTGYVAFGTMQIR